MYKTRDGTPVHDWFEGNTWFEHSYDRPAQKRRSPAKRLSDSFPNLSRTRTRGYAKVGHGTDAVHLMSQSPSRPEPCLSKDNITLTNSEAFTPNASENVSQARKYLGLSPQAPVSDQAPPDADHPWSKIRIALREPLAEFWGTFILVLFGDGAIAQVTLSKDQNSAPGGHGAGDWNSIAWGYGLGLMLGAYVAGDSGGHLNPAVTLTNCMLRKLPWRRLPAYMAAQVAGGFFAAAVVYGNYRTAIDAYEGGPGIRTVAPSPTATAGIFATYPQPFTSVGVRFGSEFLASAILMFVIFALKARSSADWFPLGLCFLLIGIGTAFGWQTGYAINPARDFGPRVLSSMAGYNGAWSAGDHYFWIPVIAPFLGCVTGGIVHDLFFYAGPSPLNTRWLGLYDLLHPRTTLRNRVSEHKNAGIV